MDINVLTAANSDQLSSVSLSSGNSGGNLKVTHWKLRAGQAEFYPPISCFGLSSQRGGRSENLLSQEVVLLFLCDVYRRNPLDVREAKSELQCGVNRRVVLLVCFLQELFFSCRRPARFCPGFCALLRDWNDWSYFLWKWFCLLDEAKCRRHAGRRFHAFFVFPLNYTNPALRAMSVLFLTKVLKFFCRKW